MPKATPKPEIKKLLMKAAINPGADERHVAVIYGPEDMFGDTHALGFPQSPAQRFDPSRPRNVQIAEEFYRLYADRDGSRRLSGFRGYHPFPDILATDSNGQSVGIELTELAYDYWLQTKARAAKFKLALYATLAHERPKYRGYAMEVYFVKGGARARIPNTSGKAGARFLREFVDCLRSSLSVTRILDSGTPGGRPFVETTIQVPTRLAELSRYVREIRLGPNTPLDPRLPSPDDPYLVLNTQLTLELGSLPSLFGRTLRRKVQGPSYTTDILLVHTWADANVLSCVEQVDPVAIGRRAVADTGADRSFRQIWLYDLWGRSLWRLDGQGDSRSS